MSSWGSNISTSAPSKRSGFGIDKLTRDTNTVSSLAHTPFEHVADAAFASGFTSTARPLYVKLELRAITNSQRKSDSAIVISSTTPQTLETIRCYGSRMLSSKPRRTG
jgi:hypothetical protein